MLIIIGQLATETQRQLWKEYYAYDYLKGNWDWGIVVSNRGLDSVLISFQIIVIYISTWMIVSLNM